MKPTLCVMLRQRTTLSSQCSLRGGPPRHHGLLTRHVSAASALRCYAVVPVGSRAVAPFNAPVLAQARLFTSIPIRRPITSSVPSRRAGRGQSAGGDGSLAAVSVAHGELLEGEEQSQRSPRPESRRGAGGLIAEDWAFSLSGQNPLGHGGDLPFLCAHDYETSDAAGLPCEIRVPRILFFGGDIVSLTALEAIYERLECIARRAFALQEEHDAAARRRMFSDGDEYDVVGWEDGDEVTAAAAALAEDGFDSRPERGLPVRNHRRHLLMQVRQRRLLKSRYVQAGDLPSSSREAERVQAFIRDHLSVICPYLPQNISPAEAARKYSRQYPVARYAVEKGLAVIPVDHARSLGKSQLLKDMLGDRGTAGTGLQHARQLRERQQQEERERRWRCETRRGRLQAFLERHFGLARATAAPLFAGPTYYFTSALLPTSAAAPTPSADETSTAPSAASASPTVTALTDMISTPWTRHGRPLKDFDLAVVVSFRYFIPPRLLEALPPTVNMHPSLLPLYRGASPIFSTLLRNEPVGGASVIQLRADQRMMDSGRVLWQCEVPIPKDMDVRTYMPLVTQLGAAGLCDTIFGEQLGRNPIWCERHQKLRFTSDEDTITAGDGQEQASEQKHRTSSSPLTGSESISDDCPCSDTRPLTSSATATTADGAAQVGQPPRASDDWQAHLERQVTKTLEATLPPPLITPEVIHAALRAHRNYVLYCEHCALTGTVPSSPSAAQQQLRCSDAFPRSVRNSYCDWPDSFWYNWRTAPEQQYEVFAHFSQDPFHAPLLPRDAAVLRFSSMSGMEAYGTWRAFVGGQYFQPSVNATLDKSCTPVRNQLSKRTLRRLVREKMKRTGKQLHQRQKLGNGGDSEAGSPQRQQAPPLREQRGPKGKGKSVLDEKLHSVSSPRSPSTDDPLTTQSVSASRAEKVGKGKDKGADKRRNNSSGTPASPPQKRRTQKASTPIDLDAAASIVDTAMLQEVEEELRLTCTFTKALHPDLVPACVLAEMEAVELGPAAAVNAPGTAAARFFRQPAPVFSSAQLAAKVREAEEARRQRRRRECVARREKAEQQQLREGVLRKHGDGGGVIVVSGPASGPIKLWRLTGRSAATTAPTSTYLTTTVRQSFAAMLPTLLSHRSTAAALAADSSKEADTAAPVAAALGKVSSDAAAGTVEPLEGEEEEDEETARRECGIVLLKTPELRMALAGEEEDGSADAGVDEEAPPEYVPDVILVAPPTTPPVPWMADIGEEVGNDFLASERVEQAEQAAVAAAAKRAEKEAENIRRNKATAAAAAAAAAAATASSANAATERRRSTFYIPTGTAYFPISDEHIGAIKCKEGWFFWQEAHLKYATRAQPVVLLRKGMAMKTGILYAGLFSEYCK